MPPDSIVTCVIVNIATPEPALDLEKFTNGVDADVPTGPLLELGDEVEWTYEVTNIGNVTLSDLTITDTVELPTPGPGPTVDCPDTTLAPGDSVTCTADPAVAEAGQYANTSVATAVDGYGTEVTDDDPSHYFGQVTSIEVVKFTNGEDANEPDRTLHRRGG